MRFKTRTLAWLSPKVHRAVALAVSAAVRAAPKLNHIAVHGWPAHEGNVVETVREFVRLSDRQVIWLDGPSASEITAMGIHNEGSQVRSVRKNSCKGIWAYCTAEVVFFTHGLYNSPRPSLRKPTVNLWHGDGPKVNVGSVVRSTYFVSGSTAFCAYRASYFEVPPERWLLTGLPRTAKLYSGTGAATLKTLGIDPAAPFVVWLPTYRATHGAGPDGSWSDTKGVDTDTSVNSAAAEMTAALFAEGIQVVVKPHPLDVNSRSISGAIALADADLAANGTTLYELMGASSGLVTDYSSAWTDYLALDRPIGFLIPDESAYTEGRGLSVMHGIADLPGPVLRTPRDYRLFAQDVRGSEDASTSSLRAEAVRRFGLTFSPNPASDLFVALNRLCVLNL